MKLCIDVSVNDNTFFVYNLPFSSQFFVLLHSKHDLPYLRDRRHIFTQGGIANSYVS